MEERKMKDEKDYSKLNEELLGVLVKPDEEITAMMAGTFFNFNGNHSKDYYVLQKVASILADKAPEVLNSVSSGYLLKADSYNGLIGKLAKYLVKNVEVEMTKDGEYRIVVPMWKKSTDSSK
jgi:hypothetical protein